MRILIAPDKFKGCLPADAVSAAIAAGLRLVGPGIEIDQCPMADGGEGTVQALVAATSGRIEMRRVTGPLPGMRVEAPIGILGDGATAVIEMSAASGLHLLSREQRDPIRTTTYGTGELLREAARLPGIRRIVLGIGGSATVDGGIGAAQAWGARFVMRSGQTHAAADRRLGGGDLSGIVRVEGVPLDTQGVELIVACDVGNPLIGPAGAAAIFGPQKGATPQQVEQLDSGLDHLARCIDRADLAAAPGSGAAGGLGFGMLAFFGARLESGARIVMDATRLPQRLVGVDLCITGEGRLDVQSLSGKAAISVARACKEAGVPCIALVGSVGPGAEAAAAEGLSAWLSICDGPMSLEQAISDAPRLLNSAAAGLMRTLSTARHTKRSV
jgi:glycerate kinase